MAAALFVAFSLLPAGLTSVRAEETGQGENTAPAAVSTKVSGLCTRLKRTSWTGTLKDSITVKPAYGREVRLYYYDSSARKWIRKKTYHTANQESAKVTLAYTSEWKTRYTTKWKITIPKKAAFTKTTGTDSSQNTGGQEGGSQAAPEIVPESKYYSKTITVTAGYLNARELAAVSTKVRSYQTYPEFDQKLGIMQPVGDITIDNRGSVDHIILSSADKLTVNLFGVVVDECTRSASDHLPIFMDFDLITE